MKLLVFLEGTVTMHASGMGHSREDIVKQAKHKKIEPGYFAAFVPIGRATQKLAAWHAAGADIAYLTSRRTDAELHEVRAVLRSNRFPEGALFFRKGNETYADVVERANPDVFIEDDCESIGADEVTTPHLNSDIRKHIKSIIVKEFVGIDTIEISELPS